MTSNFDETADGDQGDRFQELDADRNQLASLVRIPWSLMAAFGALAAWWVGSAATVETGGNYEPPLSGWMALLGVFIVTHLVRRETGIRFRSIGPRATWLAAAAVVICLALFSVSLGLVSMGMRWPVMATSVIAFGSTTWLAKNAYRAAVANLRRG